MENYKVIFPDNSAIFISARNLLSAKQKATRIANKYFFKNYPTETLYLQKLKTGKIWNKKGRRGTWTRDYEKHPVGLWQFA